MLLSFVSVDIRSCSFRCQLANAEYSDAKYAQFYRVIFYVQL